MNQANVREHLLPLLTRYDGAGSGAVSLGRLQLAGHSAVAALWDFGVAGGSCGVTEADAMLAAIDRAVAERLPLVSVLASGGTRLTEGMRALVGIPRMALGLDRLREARLPHICIADAPTTGGVWVALGCSADLRAGIAGATVAFSGPRVVEAMTGVPTAPGAGTAGSAYAAGLLDAVVTESEAVEWLTRALTALDRQDHPDYQDHGEHHDQHKALGHGEVAMPAGTADGAAVSGRALVDRLLADPVDLAAADTTVRAAVGRFGGPAGPPAVGVAMASEPAAMVSADGFGLLARAAGLADTIEAPLLVAIDTMGGDPHEETVPAAILEAMRDVLACRTPTIALVHGAGGSGGALAGAVCDVVLVGSAGWFAALAPSGAAAALRRPLDEVIDVLRPAPAQLVADGFADATYAAGDEAAVAAEALSRLAAEDTATRLARRRQRWSAALHEPGVSG